MSNVLEPTALLRSRIFGFFSLLIYLAVNTLPTLITDRGHSWRRFSTKYSYSYPENYTFKWFRVCAYWLRILCQNHVMWWLPLCFRASKCSTFANEYSGHVDKLLTIFLSKSVECIPIPDKQELVMATIDQYSAHIGLDWADKKHDAIYNLKTVNVFSMWLNIHQKHLISGWKLYTCQQRVKSDSLFITTNGSILGLPQLEW